MEIVIQWVIYGVLIGVYGFSTWLSVLNYQHRNQPIPEEVSDIYNEEDYRKWHAYNMANFKFSMIIRSINLVIFLVLLVTKVFVIFQDVSASLFANGRLQVLFFMLLYFLVNLMIDTILSYYDTFVIEEKYGFNKSTKKTFILDKIKSFVLTVIFGGALIFLLLVLNDHTGSLFFLYAWLALIVIILFVNLFYVKLIVPLFNKLSPLEDGELKDALFSLAEKVGYEVTSISVIDASKRSTRLNAYFSGLGRFKKIVLYDTLIEKMSTDEIVAVLAHEIGHNKHRHIWYNLIMTSISLLIYIGSFAVILRVPEFSTAFGFDSTNFGFSLILFFVLLRPLNILIGLIQSTLSRKFEFQADRYAALNTSKEAIVSALKVLTKENFSNLTPHPLYVKLLYSHPPTAERISSIRKVESV